MSVVLEGREVQQAGEVSEKLVQVSAIAELLLNMPDLIQGVEQSNPEHKVEQEYPP